MSIKSKLLAGTAALTMVSGAGIALSAGTALAGTPSCGPSCINLFQARYGTNPQAPNFVNDVYKRGQHIGQPIIEFRASNSDPAEDWTVSNEGQVSEFLAAGLVSPALALHYGCEPTSAGGPFPTCPPVVDQETGKVVPGTPDLYAFEWEYAPYGVDTGLCMGVAATAYPGEHATLQPCGVSSKTIWVVDFLPIVDSKSGKVVGNGAPDIQGVYGVPLINGSDTNFSHPYVLTYSGEPTAYPRASAYVTNLTGFSQGAGVLDSTGSLGTISDQQLWQYYAGILP